MRVLRFLRPVRSAVSALEASSPNEALGLDAFATEASARSTAQSDVNVARLRLALIALGVLVIIEAVPAVLWVQARLAPVQPVTTVAAAPITPTPLPVEAMSAPPCTPAPAAQTAAPVATPTSGNADAVKPAAPRAGAPGLVAGLIAITAPVPMHVYAGGRLVGTTEADTIMLPVGEHDVEFVSESVGFRARRSVMVEAGRTVAVRIDPPRVPVHINAVPWAEVWVDNQRIGETPIGNLQQTIGSHEIVFRHPELGERRMVVVVTMKEPARISMDLRKR